MALFGPFYAGKNKPIGVKPKTRKTRASVKKIKAKTLTPGTLRNERGRFTAKSKNSTAKNASPSRNCPNAARRLVSCRGKVMTRVLAKKCEKAGTNLIDCRWRK